MSTIQYLLPTLAVQIINSRRPRVTAELLYVYTKLGILNPGLVCLFFLPFFT